MMKNFPLAITAKDSVELNARRPALPEIEYLTDKRKKTMAHSFPLTFIILHTCQNIIMQYMCKGKKGVLGSSLYCSQEHAFHILLLQLTA